MQTLKNEVTQDQVARYSKLIYDRTGIRISSKKRTLISNRLRRRMKANNLDCYDAYYELLVDEGNEQEWIALFEVITTHETHLFRDQGQWDWFTGQYLQQLESLASNGERPRELRIWSAACSTGDEAYSFACSIAGTLTFPKAWKIEIIGTDIGMDTLRTAQAASFNDHAMKRVPSEWKQVFFSPDDDRGWSPSPTLKKWTQFKWHNLMTPLREPMFDLVCLKNVLIYFDQESKQTVMDNVYDSLKPGGILLTGPAEGVANFVQRYDRQKPWLFLKPDQSLKQKVGGKHV